MACRILRIAALASVLMTVACDRGSSGPAAPVSTLPAATVQDADPPPPAFLYDEADIAGLRARMERGELGSRALTQAYLDRIAAIDQAGPRLNAIIELNPHALKQAEALDAERMAGKVRGPLHGIPVLLKDNIDATGMANSAGSLALAAHRPARDAFLVRKLREGGAVILGKTNLSEWANFRSSRSTSGWSGRGGQTRNPYALDRTPCGSSSGTGTAIAASLATVGVGTETDGSILCPSAVAALVGIKPTVGLVSRSGIIPISHSQDTAGPMARSVADAAALLTAMAGQDPDDDATAQAAQYADRDYTAHLKADGLRGARIGVVRRLVGNQPDVAAAMARAIATIQAAGGEVVDVDIPTLHQWGDAEFEVLLYEFKDGLERYLAGSDAPVKTLAELIAFNRHHASTEMRYFAQELFEQAQAKGPLTDAAYLAARDKARRLAGPEGIEAALASRRLDALVAPSTSPAWPIDPINGDHFTGAGYGAAAVAGTPSITVPMGDSDGLPLGITFMGRAWSEPRLIELAHAFEQRTRARAPPRFRASVPLPH